MRRLRLSRSRRGAIMQRADKLVFSLNFRKEGSMFNFRLNLFESIGC